MIGGLEASVLVTILTGSVAREDSRNVENNRGFLIRKGVLRGWLACKGIEPVRDDCQRLAIVSLIERLTR